jgi:hypothetical protein
MIGTTDGILDKIYQSNEYQELEKQIIAAEKHLLKIASEDASKIYHNIDFLCCKQNEIVIQALKKY